MPLRPDAACVPLAADLSRKDSIGLLQALDSDGRLRLVLTGPWSMFSHLASYYIEPLGVGVSIH